MNRIFVGISILLGLIVASCQVKSEYKNWEEAELASGVIQDSVYLGVRLGMATKDFYAHCWELNKQGVIRQGSQNLTVAYEMTDLPYPAKLNFYPTFHEEKIIEVPSTIAYKAWAPWNKHLFADSLQLDLVNWMEQVYKVSFLKVEHPSRGIAYVNVQGNRRINIVKQDDQYVRLIFTDLRKKEFLGSKDSLSQKKP